MTTTAVSVGQKVYELLASNAELKKIIDINNIFPLIAEEGATFPFIVFRRNGITPTYAKNELANETVSLTVFIASKSYSDSVKIAEIVREIMELHKDSYFNLITFDGITEDFVEDSYIQELTFTAIL